MFTMTYTDPDTYESKERQFQTLDNAKAFLANNWRISIAIVKEA